MSKTWQRRGAFVTGATGLLGGRIVRELLDRQASVVVLVRDLLPTCFLTSEGLDRRCTVVRGETADVELLTRVLAEYDIDAVFHVAAQALVGVAQRAPFGTFESNVRGTYALLEAARRSAPRAAILVASSDKAYGAHDTLPYTESTPLDATNPYDASKAAADLIARSYARSFGMNVVVTRCGNLFGGGDLNWDRLIPGTVRSLLRREAPRIRSDGTLVRDYLHAQDAAQAYVELAARAAEFAGQAFNFSLERPLTVLEVVDLVADAVGTWIEPVIENHATGEIRRQFLSADKARRLLAWQPKFAMETGLGETVAWYRRYLGASPQM